jgi:hypothetical protein
MIRISMGDVPLSLGTVSADADTAVTSRGTSKSVARTGASRVVESEDGSARPRVLAL